MPRPPPRPLCLPELISNPQTRTDFVLANPPKYGPPSSRLSHSDSPYPRAPSSPTTTNDADSHRASGATLASLNSPVTPASSRTSLSVHNLPWNGDSSRSFEICEGLSSSMPRNRSEGKTWSFGKLSLGGGTPAVIRQPRASWSTAFVTTKSWFSGATAAETVEPIPSPSSQKKIILSRSMIAASTSTQSMSNRPVSSPYPSTSDVLILSPTCNVDTTRSPKVGTGLRYYTERNPAPARARTQIPDFIELQDHDRTQSPPSQYHAGAPTSTFACSTVSTPVKELPTVPDVSVHDPFTTLHRVVMEDTATLRCEDPGPLSPPPTPPVHERECNVPRIRVSFGEDS